VSDDPRASLKQIPPSSLSASLPSNGGTAGPAAVAPEPGPQSSSHGGATGVQIWLHRTTILLFVLICAVVGMLLVILPWSMAWTDNRLLWGLPGLRALLSHGFVRGLCSGLGILDLWIGFGEAVHYHEEQRTSK
jgi:hypothetical protein